MNSEHEQGNDRTADGQQPGGSQHAPDTTSDESPPGRRNRKRGLLIGGAIALGLLFLTAGAIALVLAAGPGGTSATAPETFEEKYVSGEGADKIAVLPVVGLIGPNDSSSLTPTASPETLRNQLRQAAEDDSVKAVILEINSPGGGVVSSDQMHQSIEDFKEKTKKPVVVSMDETAASGGYYISTAADKIVANPATITGSLGTILSILNYDEAEQKLGLKEEIYKSDKFKDILSGSRERTPEEQKIIQDLINEDYDQFVGVIVEGRSLSEDRVREIADGRIYSGIQAQGLGLVDELGDLEKAAEVSRDLAGVEEATVVRYKRSQGLIELLQSRLAPSKPEALQILESAGISPTPELQYLYRP
jgi:protease-4